MEYNDIFNDIPQSYFEHILREKRGKMNLEHFVNSGYSEWMSESDLAAIELTEDEMYTYAAYYYSRVVNMPKPIDISSLRTNFVNGESYEVEYNAILDFVFKYYKQVEDWYNIIIDVNSNQITFDSETVEITNSDDIYFIQNYLKTLVEKYGNGNDMRIYPGNIQFGHNGMLSGNVFYDSLPL